MTRALALVVLGLGILFAPPARAQGPLRLELSAEVTTPNASRARERRAPCTTREACLRREHDAIDLDGAAALTLSCAPLAIGAGALGWVSMLAVGYAEGDDEAMWTGLAIGSLVVGALAIVGVVYGAVAWARGSRRRAAINRELEAPVFTPFLAPSPEGTSAGVAVSGRF